MPVYQIKCPDCSHQYKSLVPEGSQMPSEWTCSQCGGRRAKPVAEHDDDFHPLSGKHAAGCPCCGG